MSKIEQTKIVTVYSEGDWCGLYVDGKLWYQGHSIAPEDFAKALGLKMENQHVDEGWMRNHGRLPDKLEDVKLE